MESQVQGGEGYRNRRCWFCWSWCVFARTFFPIRLFIPHAEIAGELRDIYPSKNITIVHNQNLPLNDVYPEKFRKDVLKRWKDDKERNINFILDDRIDQIPEGEFDSVTTVKGKTIKADLVVSFQ